MSSLSDKTPLPPLRPELNIRLAPKERDGVLRWLLHDPLRDRYFTIDDEDRRLLGLWRAGNVGSLKTAAAKAQRKVDEGRLSRLLKFVVDQQLVRADSAAQQQQLARQAAALHGAGAGWLIRRLLGTRVVLGDPQAWLQASLPWVRLLMSWPILLVWALLTLTGLWLVSRQWDQFIHTFAGLLSPEGALAYAAALAGLKLLHEMGHGWAAVHHGLRVPQMGLSFSLGFPMLYTDTSATHELDSRRARAMIGLAGVAAESLVAGLATLAWGVLQDGPLRTTAMVIATSSWVTSLAVNLNPLGRFDGYYLLADLLRIDNLQPRAKAYAGWAWSRPLLGRAELAPEPASSRRALLYIGYGTACWLYQVTLYAGIAALIWHLAGATLALPVVALGFWMMLGRPIARRLATLWQLRALISGRRRLMLAGVTAGLVALTMTPLDRQVDVPAVLGWERETVLVAADSAEVVEVLVRSGEEVREGQLLMLLQSPELEHRLKQSEIQLQLVQGLLNRTPADQADLRESQVIAQRLGEIQAEVAGLQALKSQLQVRAAADGRLTDLSPDLKPGRWVRASQTMGRLLHGQGRDVRGLVLERDLPRLWPGAQARFVADDPALPSVDLQLANLETTAVETVSPELLSSTTGGRIAARADSRGRPIPDAAYVAARFRIQANAADLPPMLLRGQVKLAARPQSLVEESAQHLWRVLMNELRQ